MERKEGLRSLTVLILLFILLSPAYLSYFDLSQANLFSPDISYESPDQDGLSMGAQSEFKGFAANVPSVCFFPQNDIFKWLFDFFYETLSIDQEPFVLRC